MPPAVRAVAARLRVKHAGIRCPLPGCRARGPSPREAYRRPPREGSWRSERREAQEPKPAPDLKRRQRSDRDTRGAPAEDPATTQPPRWEPHRTLENYEIAPRELPDPSPTPIPPRVPSPILEAWREPDPPPDPQWARYSTRNSPGRHAANPSDNEQSWPRRWRSRPFPIGEPPGY